MDGTCTKNPLFQELYVRWLHQGACTPMMRSHGTDLKREIYYFGEKGKPIYDAIEKTINLRYSLLPYIYSTSWDVSKNQSSFMRALIMDFPEDKNVWDINNEYMFGKSILVAPILHAQYTPETVVKADENEGWNQTDGSINDNAPIIDFTEKRTYQTYLPAGNTWYDYWTNQKFEGGEYV